MLTLSSSLPKLLVAAALSFAVVGGVVKDKPSHAHDPVYTADGQMKMPESYRTWVYLSSGFDMSYREGAPNDHHMFDNVFVNPEAYEAFLKTGTWPDKTVMVLENREGQSKGSINKRGQFQGDVMGLEVHVKDANRFKGEWAFFGFDDSKTGKIFPPDSTCNTCHAAHGAVDTTFVQFYPTLTAIAKAKRTLSDAFLKEESERPKE